MENLSSYQLDTAPDQRYPDPSAQAGAHAGPFYSQTHDDDPGDGDAAEFARQLVGAASTLETRDQHGVVPHDQNNRPRQNVVRRTSSPGACIAQSLPIAQRQEVSENGDASAQKKARTKVSRACDECRRKKIRCDATDIDEGKPCSSCDKTGMRCQFSRQPMKRGPSKGYIKELADRLNSLESQLQPQQQLQHPGQQHQQHQQQQPQRIAGHEFTRSGTGYHEFEQQLRDASPSTRKRTHSVSEGPNGVTEQRDSPYDPVRPGRHRWSPPRAHQPALLGRPVLPGLHPRPAGMETPVAVSVQGNHAGNGWSYGTVEEGRSREPPQPPPAQVPRESGTQASFEWDESVIDDYYRLIQGTFPLLPHSKGKLRARLLQCPTTLREAFLAAIESCVRSSPSTLLSPSPDVRQSTRRAAELIALSQYDAVSTRTSSAHFVYIQALVLMALESDNHGPATMRGQVGPPRAEWLGRAIGMATHLKLNIPRNRDRFAESDADSDEKLGRRIWWILFILDRWHASSTSCLLQLADSSSSLLPEDQILLGDSSYQLARLSFILGHVCQIMQQPPSLMNPSSAAAPIISTTILGEIDRFRESVESMLLGAPNLVHLCYWHVRLLVLRLTSSTTPHELLTPASRMASILNSSHTMITPLNHHFAALAAMTLCELCDFEETRKGAEEGIKEIAEALGSHRGLMSKENGTGWDSAIRELVTGKIRHGPAAGVAALLSGPVLENGQGDRGQGLQRRVVDGTVSPYDHTVVVRYGYLAALVNEETTR